jgi:hypothetical protein
MIRSDVLRAYQAGGALAIDVSTEEGRECMRQLEAENAAFLRREQIATTLLARMVPFDRNASEYEIDRLPALAVRLADKLIAELSKPPKEQA